MSGGSEAETGAGVGPGTVRLLLVDDEQPARERLRRLLAGDDRVEVVGEAIDGSDALDKIESLRPDAVFLDIQMPGCTGLEVAASLSAPRPKIVFCTAYDEHAVEAFELHAVDYLLKPVSRARLGQALDRLGIVDDAAVDAAQRATAPFPTRFLGKRGSAYHVVSVDDAVFFLSDEGQTRLQTPEGHYWLQPSLNELEERLDPQRFFRISRAAILGLDHVVQVVPTGNGQGEVKLIGDVELPVSRRRYRELLDRLGL